METFYTLKEVREILKVSMGTLRNIIKRGDIKTFRRKAERKLFIKEKALIEYMKGEWWIVNIIKVMAQAQALVMVMVLVMVLVMVSEQALKMNKMILFG